MIAKNSFIDLVFNCLVPINNLTIPLMKLYYFLPVLLLSASVAVSYGQSQGPIPTKRSGAGHVGQDKQTEHQKESETDKCGTEDRPLVVKVLNPDLKEEVPKEETKGTNGHYTQTSFFPWLKRFGQWIINVSSTDILLAFFTLLLAIFTYRLWRSTDKMWEATQKLTKITEQSGDYIPAIERARLFVSIDENPSYLGEGPNQLGLTATIRLHNEGKTPATLTDILVGMRTLSDYPRGIDTYMKETKTERGSIYMRAGESETIYKPATVDNITKQLDQLRNRQVMLLCYGCVRYEDVLGDKWERWFCCEFVSSGVVSGGTFRMSPEGNYENKYT